MQRKYSDEYGNVIEVPDRMPEPGPELEEVRLLVSMRKLQFDPSKSERPFSLPEPRPARSISRQKTFDLRPTPAAGPNRLFRGDDTVDRCRESHLARQSYRY